MTSPTARTTPGRARTAGSVLLIWLLASVIGALLPASPATGAAGGPLVLMGIDGEDGGPNGHGPIANYVQIVNSVLANVTSGGTGILVVDSATSSTANTRTFWNAISAGSGKPVTYVSGPAISTQPLGGFAMVAVASDFRNTPGGGLNAADNLRLGARRSAVAAFVNGGGGLMGFSSNFTASEGGPYPYLGDLGSFTFNFPPQYSNITPTTDGLAIGITNAFDVCCWHDEYVTFPAFLKVLARNASTGRAAAIGGVNVVISDIVLSPPSQSAPVGSTQTVTAAVTVNNNPAVGKTVTFTAVSGPNAGVLGTTVTNSSGEAAFSYSSTLAGTDTIEASFIDATGTTQTSNRVLVEWQPTNRPPLVSAGGPYAGDEGTPLTLSGTASDPDPGDTVAVQWTYASTSNVDTGATCTFGSPNAVVTTFSCTDDGDYSVTLTGTDSHNVSRDSVAVTILKNVAPSVGLITAPLDPVAVNTGVNASAPFTDPGTNDTHTCSVDWGDTTSSAGNIAGGTCSANHAYTAAGIYTLKLSVTDDDGDSGNSIFQYVVVYDASAGFVTGGGWIDSPAGAYTADPSLTGRANFGFVSKYKKGATVPDGNTQFQFHAGNLNFHSTSYEWLVVSGPKAQYKGSGTINGAGDYGFMLTANDGQVTGGGGADRFRIKIWDKATGGVIYDNQSGSADDAAAADAIEGGSIVIHTKK